MLWIQEFHGSNSSKARTSRYVLAILHMVMVRRHGWMCEVTLNESRMKQVVAFMSSLMWPTAAKEKGDV